jgi:hypothetical protein
MAMQCIHIAKEPNQIQYRVTPHSTGIRHELCASCYEVYKNDPRKSPVESIGYNVYFSLDPDLPKDQWTKANDTPIPPTESGRVQYRIPGSRFVKGATYYSYVASINAIGLENPSKVIKVESPDIDLPVF